VRKAGWRTCRIKHPPKTTALLDQLVTKHE